MSYVRCDCRIGRLGMNVRATFCESGLNTVAELLDSLLGRSAPFYALFSRPAFAEDRKQQRHHIRQICEAGYPRQPCEIW